MLRFRRGSPQCYHGDLWQIAGAQEAAPALPWKQIALEEQRKLFYLTRDSLRVNILRSRRQLHCIRGEYQMDPNADIRMR